MDLSRFCLVSPQEFIHPFFNNSYYRTCNQQTSIKGSGSTICNEEDQFKITIDVRDYSPDDISVKVTDKEIIIEGNHEERHDGYGYVTRQFKRRYALPSDCSSDSVTSTLSSDAVLTVVADKKAINRTEKLVPIKLCGLKTEQFEKRTRSGITQQDIDDTIKEAKDLVNRNMVQDEHSRLLKSNILSETVSSKNGADQRESEAIQKKSSNGHATTSKIVEEAVNKSNIEKSEVAEQLGHTSVASGSLSSKTVAHESYHETKSSSQSVSMSMKASDKNTL